MYFIIIGIVPYLTFTCQKWIVFYSATTNRGPGNDTYFDTRIDFN